MGRFSIFAKSTQFPSLETLARFIKSLTVLFRGHDPLHISRESPSKQLDRLGSVANIGSPLVKELNHKLATREGAVPLER
jgi:hypothetical protein